VDGQLLQPGITLAGRYRVEDLIGEVAGARSWRAMDTILNRSVGIQALPSDDPRTAAFLDAARQSTAVPDPRFLRVLDAVADEEGMTYVVREWTRAIPLADLLREGPLSNRRAATLVREAADAIARAHEVGVYHRRIDPATILVKDNDAVRITGLGTDHVLHASGRVPAPASDGALDGAGAPASTAQAVRAEQVDVSALGRLLYACLVARWPGGRDFGLPAAPTDHTRLLRPRQVRAGVSRDLDSICDRILNDPPRNHAPPLRSARDIAQALTLAGEDESQLTDTAPSLTGGPTVAVAFPRVEPPPSPPPGSPGPRPAPDTSPPRERPATRRPAAAGRALVALGVALLVAMAAVLAFVVGRQTAGNDGGPPAAPSADETGQASPQLRQLDPADVTDFDPQGEDLTENPDQAPYAIDGRRSTSWTTSQYRGSPLFGGLDKRGVGLLLDLGADKSVSAVEISFGNSPTRYEVWAAPPGTTTAPSQLSELEKLVSGEANGPYARVRFDPTETRYVLVWLTLLPEEAPGLYRGVIRDIVVEGTA